LLNLPGIETVIQKTGQVSGPYRTYPYTLLAGRNETRVSLTESGVSLQFDLADVYWCSRLSEERQRLLSMEIGTTTKEQSNNSVVVADAFCGVGALCLQAAKRYNCTIWANDWNPAAIQSLQQNAAKNGLQSHFEHVQCGDAYDFIMDLGLKQQQSTDEKHDSHKKGIRCRLPDHVVLNFPLESPQFLGALRWWPAGDDDDDNVVIPRVHVYTFARADKETYRSAEDVAVDLVASNLLPMACSSLNNNQNYDPTINRRAELNEEYDCRVSIHPVRDVAPGKVVMCVSFSATPKLLRYMKGDFR
jgi:tRNA (guanine37-N1)-methyltransferase